jgi:transcriptional regulator with PAS, ATPase and Fis domain
MNYSENIAKVDSTIIIYGESGCGKELFAKYIHSKSLRASEVFIPINCASLPPTLLEAELFGYEKGTFTGGDKNGKIGIFEFANRGTIFLDEIGEMPLELQAKLLRIIESGEIKRLGSNKLIKSDVRIIAATNRNLYEMVQEKTFRADLYYRLNVLVINVPPLRERHEDIKPLAQHFVNTFNKKFGFTKILSSELIERMESYPWPGNVRELKNIVERMMVSTQSNIIDKASFNVGDTASPTASKNSDSLPEYELPYQDAVAAFEKRYLEHTLASCENDVRRAARKTNLHLSTLYRKIKEHQL